MERRLLKNFLHKKVASDSSLFYRNALILFSALFNVYISSSVQFFFRMAIVQYIEIDAQLDMIRCTDSFKHLVPFQRISKKTGLFNLTRAISPLKFK